MAVPENELFKNYVFIHEAQFAEFLGIHDDPEELQFAN